MKETGWVIRDLRLKLRLGWGSAERSRPQAVRFDVELRFTRPPRGCLTDRLDDTVCYDQASQCIAKLASREFRLLEFLAQEAHDSVKRLAPKGARLRVEVTKVKAPIRDLKGDVRFFVSDW